VKPLNYSSTGYVSAIAYLQEGIYSIVSQIA
jgi:hypothetical protein